MDATRRVILHNERGVALVYLALTLAVLMGMGALAVDIGYMYVAKSQLQNAADAAALAGAAKLNGNVVVTGTTFGNYSARLYAKNFALRNSSAGMPVILALNETSNDSDGDIFLCVWDGVEPCKDPVAEGREPNAVQVVARKTGEGDDLVKAKNSKVPLFFAKVINSTWSSMAVTAKSIASNTKAGVSPIVVNEYWMAGDGPPGQRPYGNDQQYPNSFVRKINVDSPTSSSTVFGKTFALFGTRAGNNTVSVYDTSVTKKGGGVVDNVNGYVNLDYRNSDNSHNSDIYTTWTKATSSSACPCTYTPVNPLIQGAINSDKHGSSLGYLFNGYPDTYLPPFPVKEVYATNYPNSVLTPTPPTSVCPYSTVAYFSDGGAGLSSASTDSPIKKSYSGKAFIDQFPPGKKIITLVYDGIPNVNGSGPNSTNIVGYSLVQIDGYSNKIPKQLIDNSGNIDPTFFSNDKNVVSTLYGHAVSDILEGGGTCVEFLSKLRRLQYEGGTVRLVK